MMTAFVDTLFYLALANADDEYHEAASALARSFRGRLVTTDCISFVVMQEHGLTEAFTGDHHFEQAGFRALLRPGGR